MVTRAGLRVKLVFLLNTGLCRERGGSVGWGRGPEEQEGPSKSPLARLLRGHGPRPADLSAFTRKRRDRVWSGFIQAGRRVAGTGRASGSRPQSRCSARAAGLVLPQRAAYSRASQEPRLFRAPSPSILTASLQRLTQPYSAVPLHQCPLLTSLGPPHPCVQGVCVTEAVTHRGRPDHQDASPRLSSSGDAWCTCPLSRPEELGLPRLAVRTKSG